MSCLFCKIIAGEIPSSKVYEDDRLFAFDDIHPQAPMHVLVVPKQHIATLNDVSAADDGLVGAMVRTAAAIAKERGFDGPGFRTVFNCNAQSAPTNQRTPTREGCVAEAAKGGGGMTARSTCQATSAVYSRP